MAAVTKKVLPHRRREDESGQEPVSGVEGQRGSPPPYDAGNQQGKHCPDITAVHLPYHGIVLTLRH